MGTMDNIYQEEMAYHGKTTTGPKPAASVVAGLSEKLAAHYSTKASKRNVAIDKTIATLSEHLQEVYANRIGDSFSG